MAPQNSGKIGMKRAAVSHQGSMPKRQKETKDPFAAKAKIVAGVLNDSSRHEAQVPADVRRMLAAAIPHALLVVIEERQIMQITMVERIGEVLQEISAGYAAKYDEARCVVDSHVAEQQACEKDRDAKLSAVADADLLIETTRNAVDNAEDEITRAEAEETKAKCGHQEAEVAHQKVEQQRVKCQAVFQGGFMALVEGEWSHDHLVELKSCLTELGVEVSLLMGLPPALAKKPEDRSDFDRMLVQSVETVFKEKAIVLEQELLVFREAVDRMVAAVSDAGASLKSAQQRHVEIDARLNKAVEAKDVLMKQSKEAKAALQAKNRSMTASLGTQTRAEHIRVEFDAAMDAFKDLKARSASPPPEDETKLGPDVEQAVQQAMDHNQETAPPACDV